MKQYNEKIFWDNERHFLDDGKFHMDVVHRTMEGIENPAYFPGYIDNKEHPLFFCNSITHRDIDGNLTFDWCGSDGPNEFEKNKVKMGPSWKYLTKKVNYKINSSGYRTYDWNQIDWPNAILLLGCSSTYGVGVAEDETLSYYLENLTGRQVVNLGTPGGSNSLISYLCALVLEKFSTPYAIVVNWTTGDRYRHFFKNRYFDVGPWNSKKVSGLVEERVDGLNLSLAWENRYINRYHELAENYYISKTVKAMCQSTKYVTLSYFDYMAHINRADICISADPLARDLIHPSSKIHETAATEIYKLL